MELLGKVAFSAGAGAFAIPLWAPLVLAPIHKATSCNMTLRVVVRSSLTSRQTVDFEAARSGPCLGKVAAIGLSLLGRGGIPSRMDGPRGRIISGMVGPKCGQKRRLWVVAAQPTSWRSLTQ